MNDATMILGRVALLSMLVGAACESTPTAPSGPVVGPILMCDGVRLWRTAGGSHEFHQPFEYHEVTVQQSCNDPERDPEDFATYYVVVIEFENGKLAGCYGNRITPALGNTDRGIVRWRQPGKGPCNIPHDLNPPDSYPYPLPEREWRTEYDRCYWDGHAWAGECTFLYGLEHDTCAADSDPCWPDFPEELSTAHSALVS